jgi:hypothetical protein
MLSHQCLTKIIPADYTAVTKPLTGARCTYFVELYGWIEEGFQPAGSVKLAKLAAGSQGEPGT